MHSYKKFKPQIWAFIKKSFFGTFRDPCIPSYRAQNDGTEVPGQWWWYGDGRQRPWRQWDGHGDRVRSFLTIWRVELKWLKFLITCSSSIDTRRIFHLQPRWEDWRQGECLLPQLVGKFYDQQQWCDVRWEQLQPLLLMSVNKYSKLQVLPCWRLRCGRAQAGPGHHLLCVRGHVLWASCRQEPQSGEPD